MNVSGGPLGFAGRLAAAMIHSKLTPLLAAASLLLGLLAAATLPREEEPQIQVPMIDVQILWPGASVDEVERQLTSPVERKLSQIPDLEYLYSTSRDDGALLIARFKVGSNAEDAMVRLQSRLQEVQSELPQGSRLGPVAARSIDDVPVLSVTLWSPTREDFDQNTLRSIAAELRSELQKTPGVARIEILGGQPREFRVEPDPSRMASSNVHVDAMLGALASAEARLPAGTVVRRNEERELRAEALLTSVAELRNLAVTAANDRPLRLSEIARVEDGPGETTDFVFHAEKNGGFHPAVTLSVSKLPGVNATQLTAALRARVAELQTVLLTRDVQASITRDYGVTAKHKSDDLMLHLVLATLSVVALIAFALGKREAVVVAIAIPVTLALTLFIFRLFGYTLNRVTLFALIFSIGILVDDAIVVVENIARHFQMKDGRDADRRAIDAVAEVGNPTILATFAVIAAILPLAFVGGLMGPYMKPIPVGASMAMLFSLLVAFTISPWASRRVLQLHAHASSESGEQAGSDRLYRKIMGKLLSDPKTRRLYFLGILILFGAALSLLPLRAVSVKMLPFDNKSEFQVLLDLPPDAPLERTLALAQEVAAHLVKEPEVEDVQAYVASGAPVNFNGLVRHYDMRREARFADLQVNLVHAGDRTQQSHAIARRIRPALTALGERHGARVKVVEVPPGPPVLSTLVAEVYGPDLQGQRDLARQLFELFSETRGVVDADILLTENKPRERLTVDRERAALAGANPAQIVDATSALYSGREVARVHAPDEAEAVPVNVRLAAADRADLAALRSLRLGSGPGTPLSELVNGSTGVAAPEIHHKNGHRVVYVLGDVAGEVESPVYAIGDLGPKLRAMKGPDGQPLRILSTELPQSDESYSMKWDGEWHITIEVFRDMGAAFAVVLVLIYIITVGWFRSLATPFVIMLPIPLSLVGILPAHAMLGAFFTATSMIGFIAGAGISVRNSIILVDFIEMRRAQGQPLLDAVVDAGAIRFRPMVLTAAAVAVGAGVILFDPIFQGLAVALIGGEIAATLLSRMTVPVLIYLLRAREERLQGGVV